MRLHHEAIHAPQAEPERWLWVLHGVFGAGGNWRLFMRDIAKTRAQWGFLLVDLRGHGRSPRGDEPHTLDAAADDVLRLEAELGLDLRGVVGHSLGGKVALAYEQRRAEPPEQTWVLDTQPGPQSHDGSPTTQVLELLEALPDSFDDRKSFVTALEQRGLSRAIASWLAMSLRRDDAGRQRLVLDLPVIRALLEDHYRRDMWSALETPRSRHLHVVYAADSFVWRRGDLERLGTLAGDRMHVHTLEGAGHWVHVDAPDALAALICAAL